MHKKKIRKLNLNVFYKNIVEPILKIFVVAAVLFIFYMLAKFASLSIDRHYTINAEQINKWRVEERSVR